MAEIIISQAPEDPAEKEAWANSMLRIQFAMWVDDGASCAECGHVYESTDDMINRDPRYTGKELWEEKFVDEACWQSYLEKNPGSSSG